MRNVESSGRGFSLSANHVGVTVSDLGRSIAFYRDLLGFRVAYERGEVTAEYMPRLVGILGARLKIAGLDIPGLHLDIVDPMPANGFGYLAPDACFYSSFIFLGVVPDARL